MECGTGIFNDSLKASASSEVQHAARREREQLYDEWYQSMVMHEQLLEIQAHMHRIAQRPSRTWFRKEVRNG